MYVLYSIYLTDCLSFSVLYKPLHYILLFITSYTDLGNLIKCIFPLGNAVAHGIVSQQSITCWQLAFYSYIGQ